MQSYWDTNDYKDDDDDAYNAYIDNIINIANNSDKQKLRQLFEQSKTDPAYRNKIICNVLEGKPDDELETDIDQKYNDPHILLSGLWDRCKILFMQSMLKEQFFGKITPDLYGTLYICRVPIEKGDYHMFIMIHTNNVYYTIFVGYDSSTKKTIFQSPDVILFKYHDKIEILDFLDMPLYDFMKDLGILIQKLRNNDDIQHITSDRITYYFILMKDTIRYARGKAFLFPNYENCITFWWKNMPKYFEVVLGNIYSMRIIRPVSLWHAIIPTIGVILLFL